MQRTLPRLLHGASARIWTVKGARPDRSFSYRGLARLSRLGQNMGAVTPLYESVPEDYDARRIRGLSIAPVLPVDAALTFRASYNASEVLSDAKGCPLDIRVQIGTCQDPKDPNAWDRIIVIRNAHPNLYVMGEVGFEVDSIGTEAIGFTAEEVYEILPTVGDLRTETDDPVRVIVRGLRAACAGCPPAPIVIAASDADLYSSEDDGLTWEQHVNGFAATPTSAVLVNGYLVVGFDNGGYEWFLLDDLTAGTGVSIASGDLHLYANDEGILFVADEGGEVRKIADVEIGETETLYSSATVWRTLNGRKSTLVAGGTAGALIISRNDGRSWVSRTLSASGAIVSIVFVSDTTWFVSSSDGEVFYTVDGGTTWTEISLSTQAGEVRLAFHDTLVGWALKIPNSGSPVVYRTVDGGASWSELPWADSAVTLWRTLLSVDANTLIVGGSSASGGVLTRFSA